MDIYRPAVYTVHFPPQSEEVNNRNLPPHLLPHLYSEKNRSIDHSSLERGFIFSPSSACNSLSLIFHSLLLPTKRGVRPYPTPTHLAVVACSLLVGENPRWVLYPVVGISRHYFAAIPQRKGIHSILPPLSNHPSNTLVPGGIQDDEKVETGIIVPTQTADEW